MDTHLFPGYLMPPYYDSLLAKVIAWGNDRGEAVARMRRALEEFKVVGVTTNIPFQLQLLANPDFLEGRFDTHFVERWLTSRGSRGTDDGRALVAAGA